MRAFCRLSSRLIFAAALAALAAKFPSALFAQQSSAVQSAPVAPRPLITQPFDEALLTVQKGNTHPLARPEFDLGTAPATLPMQRMLLVLKRSPEQEAALRKLLDDQQDKASPRYHNWLTPEQFGQQFGPTESDMQTIRSWLQSYGFQVESTKGRTVLEFSGSASQVKEAFHTSIHKYVVNGEQHWANSSDPSIPTALTPAVAGVLTLHDFLKRSHIRFSPQPVAAKLVSRGPGQRPQVTFPAQNGQPVTNALAPQDYAVIYHMSPLNVDVIGNGTTIGVVGRSNLYNGGQDVDNYFSAIGSANNFNRPAFSIVLDGPDPGDLGGGEEAEATLDSTWSGAIAPGATVNLVVSASTNTTDGTDLSELYIVENNLADIMTESFGNCEYDSTDSQVAGVNALAEQAAAQGITYFVSTGDDGAEGCDDPDSETVASGPLSVNVLASTPYTVAVGGTQFNESGDETKYWTSSAPISETAISYIPEDVWNASCLGSACGSNAGIWAGSGGVSSGNIANGGTFTGFPKPVWQTGFGDGLRDVPDVALTAAEHDPYLLCIEGSCLPDAQGNIYIYLVWGTSAAAPSFAGIMAMVDEQASAPNYFPAPRQGQADYVLYSLAASQQKNTALTGLCNGSITSALPNAACVFNDVTVGNNAVPGEANYGLANADYQAGAGYDMASGLGSVNVTNLVNQWNSAASKFHATTTSLTFNSSTTLVHGSPLNFTAAVAPTSATGTATGDVALLISAFPVVQGEGFFTLTGGSVSSSISSLPGGTYALVAQYGGDSMFAGSTSLPTPDVMISAEPSTTTLSVLTFNQAGNGIPFTGGAFGSFVYLRADVAGKSGQGTPTGTVTFSDSFGPIPGISTPYTLNSQGNSATPNGVITFDTGTHTLSASYSGDASFNGTAVAGSTSSSPITFTIQPGFFAAVTSSQVPVTATGSSGSTSVNVSSSTGFSSTITLACSGLPAGAACQFSPSTIKAPGTLTTTPSAITVTTTAAAAELLHSPRRLFLAHWLPGLGLLFSVVLIGGPRRRTRAMFLWLMLLMMVAVPGCGGGSSNSTPPAPPPVVSTPTGSYRVVVTASSGSTTSATGFTLLVQ
jgi:pro-kumamolisin-like protein/Big-like domain-containing protein